MHLSRTTRKILVCILPTLIIVGGFILLYDVSSVLANEGAGQTPQQAAPGTETQNNAIARILWWVVASVFGGLTWLTGMLLDFAITELVLKFGTLFQSSGLGVAVNQLWSVVRDIFNLTFIFGLVYIGFRLVIDSESSAARKAIVNLIIAALLVNFSLFITKTVIDFSNIAAVQVAGLIYNSGGAPNNSISLAFGNQMGLSSLWGQSAAEMQQQRANNNNNTAPSGGLLYIFGAMILFIIAAFSFAVGFVMLVSRFITLNFMMILSPIMFLGLVFSSLSGYSKDYWNKFLKNCFFAPAFLLMLYFSLYILGTFTGMVRNGGSAAAAFANGSNVSAIAGFLLGGGFLVGSVLVAQKMSMAGSSTMIKFGNSMVGKARGMATGAALAAPRFGGRIVTGNAAKYGEKLNNRLQTTPTGRLFKKGVSIVSMGSFTERERLAAIEAGKKAKFGGSRSWQDDQDFKDKTQARTKVLTDAADLEKQIVKLDTAGAAATAQDKIDTERAIADAGSEQISKLLTSKKLNAQQKSILIGGLSNSQYDTVMKAKEEEISQADKDTITTARQKSIETSLGNKAIAAAVAAGKAPPAGVDALIAGIGKASSEQLKTLGGKIVADHASGLSFSQIDDIKKSKDFTETEKERIITAHKLAFTDQFNALTTSAQRTTFFAKFKDSDFAQLPSDILKSTETIPHFTVGALDKIADKESLNPTERANIRRIIQSMAKQATANPIKTAIGDKMIALDKWLDGPRGANF